MINNYHTSKQGLLARLGIEIEHLHYHSFRLGTLPLADEAASVQRIINDLQSLIGYGTAAEPYASGEREAFHYAMTRCHQDYDKIIFDIGAHNGEYLKQTIREGAVFHCFEPEPDSFAKLSEEYRKVKNVFLNKCAVSTFDGDAPLYSHEPGAAQSALDRPDFAYLGADFKQSATVQVCSLQSYCQRNGIEQIDFLKIDTEGHEFRIIESAIVMILARKIHFIQFEFGICDVDLKIFMKDFWRLLSPHYNFFRVHPEGLIPIDRYVQELEVFHVANYLCELKD